MDHHVVVNYQMFTVLIYQAVEIICSLLFFEGPPSLLPSPLEAFLNEENTFGEGVKSEQIASKSGNERDF